MELSYSDDNRILPLAFAMMKGKSMALRRRLDECGLSLEAFFSISIADIAAKLEANPATIPDSFARQEASEAAIRELEFCDRHSIRVLFPHSPEYPLRLLELNDAPTALFALGNTDLNASRTIAFVGTRTPTPYGLTFTRSAVEELRHYSPIIVSGLAYGIDAAAHTAALTSGLPTIAVVAHGLDTLYPASHRDLARRIISSGGAILSEYPSGIKPFKGNFLERNRIVAALSDACVVAESEIKGGAMSTASVAFDINREVMALPGRTSDRFSSGCNHLIHKNKAWLVGSASDITTILNWQPSDSSFSTSRSLFPDLDEPCSSIYSILEAASEPMTVDQLHARLSIPIASLLAQLGEMEFDGLAVRFPGNRWKNA